MMKKSLSEKMMLPMQKKKSQIVTKSRFLIVVNVLGSAGPLKFVVNEDDTVSVLIDTTLKMYAREGRLPVLGSDVGDFLLYPVNSGSDALKLSETIGSTRGRHFIMCKNNKAELNEIRSEMVARKGSTGWRTWLNKPFAFNVSSR